MTKPFLAEDDVIDLEAGHVEILGTVASEPQSYKTGKGIAFGHMVVEPAEGGNEVIVRMTGKQAAAAASLTIGQLVKVTGELTVASYSTETLEPDGSDELLDAEIVSLDGDVRVYTKTENNRWARVK